MSSAEKDAMKSLLRNEPPSGGEKKVRFGQENIGDLKSKMKEALLEEYAEVKSGIRPSTAHKIYPWRRYLNKVFESEVPDYKYGHLSQEKSLPPFDPIAAMVTVFHDPNKVSNVNDFVDYSRIASIRCVNGIFKASKPSLSLLEEKTPYFPLMPPQKDRTPGSGSQGYALDWPFVDKNGGHSIYGKRP